MSSFDSDEQLILHTFFHNSRILSLCQILGLQKWIKKMPVISKFMGQDIHSQFTVIRALTEVATKKNPLKAQRVSGQVQAPGCIYSVSCYYCVINDDQHLPRSPPIHPCSLPAFHPWGWLGYISQLHDYRFKGTGLGRPTRKAGRLQSRGITQPTRETLHLRVWSTWPIMIQLVLHFPIPLLSMCLQVFWKGIPENKGQVEGLGY